MGFNIQSSSTQQTIEDFTNVVNSAVEKAKNEASLQCQAANNISVLLGSVPNPPGAPIPCPTNVEGNVNITQNAQARCDLSGQFTNDFQTAITNNVQSDIEQWIKNNLQSNQGWLAIAFSAQIAQNQTAATVSTTLTNGLVADITNTCSAEIFASNNAMVSICGNYAGDFNFNQSAFVTNLTSCVAKNTISFVANNEVLNKMSQTADNQLSSDQQGLWSGLRWVILGAIIIAVVVVIAVLLYFIFGGKSKPSISGPARALGLEGKEILAECLTSVRRRIGEEGRSFNIEEAKPLVERCILEKKRSEGRERYSERHESRYDDRRDRDY